MVVITYEREIISLKEMSEPNYGTERRLILEEGVYMFGGLRGETSNEMRTSSNVYVMKLGNIHLAS
jgi:hypothetical protein